MHVFVSILATLIQAKIEQIISYSLSFDRPYEFLFVEKQLLIITTLRIWSLLGCVLHERRKLIFMIWRITISHPFLPAKSRVRHRDKNMKIENFFLSTFWIDHLNLISSTWTVELLLSCHASGFPNIWNVIMEIIIYLLEYHCINLLRFIPAN